MPVKLSIVRQGTGQVKIKWLGQSGHIYQVRRTRDLIVWENYGQEISGEDDVEIEAVVEKEVTGNWFFNVLDNMMQGTEPKAQVVTALDGSYVLVEWESLGLPVSTGRYELRRNGQLLATVGGNVLNYMDRTVQSRGLYRYKVGYFS